MSDSDNEELSETSHNASCTLQLVTYTATSQGKGVKKKTVLKKDSQKTTKSMKFTFDSEAESNYLDFLGAILVKFGLDKTYKVSDSRRYKIRVQVPPQKAGQANDVDTSEEFDEVVQAILQRRPGSEKPITIAVDQQDIAKGAKTAKSTRNAAEGSEDEDEEDGEEDDQGLSAEEQRAVKFRQLIAKEWGDEDGNTITWINNSTGEAVRCSNVMVEAWVRAMLDGSTSYKEPPADDERFFPERQRTKRNDPATSCENRSSSAPADTSDKDLVMLSHVTSLVSSITDLATSRGHSVLPLAPVTVLPASPPRNSPTKLPRFLKDLEKAGTVPHASRHLYALEDKSYGPDILHLVDQKMLEDLGIKSGDAIRLRSEATIWWNSAAAKRKAAKAPAGDGRSDGNDKRRRLIRLEKRYKDGEGRMSCQGYVELSTSDEPECSPDYDWFFYCEELQARIPVPAGYSVTVKGGDDDNSFFS
ncbi:hypothetical protein D9757_010410 [Collybiopsis confluens]|uniref:SAM domain-containing protein n=1 Tax=Collybiopsis confluens TaxID=2823264 RepID=A0A8H5LSV0_9AGAR|nr:hypothetical protein D9757_010410 [Collybiopsis confluens]